jgi:beta-mannosidase
MCVTPSAGALEPGGLGDAGLTWWPAAVPGTVAASLRATGRWSLDAPARPFDSEEWWYRVRFPAEPVNGAERVVLGLDGLATLADVWLNGTALCTSANMFIEHRCDVGALLALDNELLIRFSPIDAFLRTRRPRPRWRTPMVAHQQLRWLRTTLLGRTPGWSPPAAAVGPWRSVWLERRRLVELGPLRLQACLEGDVGTLRISCEVTTLAAAKLLAAQLSVSRAGKVYTADLSVSQNPLRVLGELRIPGVDPWWPHTHGEPALYRAQLQLILDGGDGAGSGPVEVDLGNVGFRSVQLDREQGNFSIRVNGVKIFCRGACWTPLDPVSLHASDDEYSAALRCVVDAGMNMLRVAGPMVYESDRFLDLCDSLGMLVWQDFMFANMDYPEGDADFLAGVRHEARQQLARLQARPSLAVLCGNSEASQQAAMSGAAREYWNSPLFDVELASLAREYCGDVPYSPSSTHGGAFPHQASAGVTSYYGVGAYLRRLSDARRSELRFASECLGFANVPEDETLALLTQGSALRCHDARWKERVPRDRGAGWDFDDVRDHYLTELYRLQALSVRYADSDRYLRLSRAASGEVMAACFNEWRRARSTCGGALLWFLRDLWPGAGWGVVDSTGLPKAAYYYLKRALQPLALSISDEGGNGLAIHIANDGPRRLAARLELRLFRFSQLQGPVSATALTLDAASTIELAATDLLDGFMDLSYAYRFGPPPFDVLHARLCLDGPPRATADPARPAGAAAVAEPLTLTENFFFPLGLPNAAEADVGLSAVFAPVDERTCRLSIHSKRFAQSVHVESPGMVSDDQYFHMAPDSTRVLTLHARAATLPPRLQGTVYALNSAAACRVALGP